MNKARAKIPHNLIAGVVLAVFANGSAFAGDYAKFCDADKLKALEGAMKLAEKAVETREAGCVGPGKDPGFPASKNYPNENGEKCVGVHYNHTNGACGIKKTPREMWEELGI